MANKGYVQTRYYHNIAQRVSWVAKPDLNRRVAKITWTMTSVWKDSSRIIYHLAHNSQIVKINGKEVCNFGMWFKGSGKSLAHNSKDYIYNAFTKPGSWLDTNKNLQNYHDDPVKYGDKGWPRWVHILGTNHHSGTIEIPYDENGNATLKLNCNFAWHEDDRIKANGTFALDCIGPPKRTITYNKGATPYVDDSSKSYNVAGMPGNSIITKGDRIVAPPAPRCEAYDFDYWDYGAYGHKKPGDYVGPIYDNITVYARWKIKSYTWLFDTNWDKQSRDYNPNHLADYCSCMEVSRYPSINPAIINHKYEATESFPVIEDMDDIDYFKIHWEDFDWSNRVRDYYEAGEVVKTEGISHYQMI